MRQNQDSLPGDSASISCSGKESRDLGRPNPPLNHELEAPVAFQPVGSQNSCSQDASDVFHDSIPTTTILSSTIDEELRSPSHCSVDHCLPSDLPCSSPQSTFPPHSSDPQSDLKPDSNAHNRCPLHHASSDPSLEDPYASDQELAHFPDRSDKLVGVKSISCGRFHSLLFTHSGEVYFWGSSRSNGREYDYFDDTLTLSSFSNFIPTLLPFKEFDSLVSLLDSLFVWYFYLKGPEFMKYFDLWNIPYKLKEFYFPTCNCRNFPFSFFALTEGGKVIHFDGDTHIIIEGLNKIVFMSVCCRSFVAVDVNGVFFFHNTECVDYHSDGFCLDTASITTKIDVSKYITPRKPFRNSFFFSEDWLFIIDVNGDVWKFNNVRAFDHVDEIPFSNKPIKGPGLNNIVYISGSTCWCCSDLALRYNDGIYAAINNNGKVFVWGKLSRLSCLYNDIEQPICVEAFTNIEGVSLGHDFLFAYNKNTVLAWGKNDEGQLGTGDLIDRPQPAKLSFGSEILGIFLDPIQTMDSIFSGLIRLIYFEYLQYLKKLFGNHPYTKARFYTKCSVSKKVAKFSKEVINGFEFLKNPQHLNLNDYVWDLQLQLSFAFNGPSVINSRIKHLDFYYDTDVFDPQFLSFFPTVEVVKLGAMSGYYRRLSLNLTHLSNLKFLELNCSFIIEQLPPSLVKLVLKGDFEVTDLSNLTALKELVLFDGSSSERILEAQIPLPLSITILEVWLRNPVNIEIELPSIKELIIHEAIDTNITEQSFPSLEFIQLLGPERNLSISSLSPTKLYNQGVIKATKLIKNEYLVELSCFPWCFKYPYYRLFALTRALESDSTLTTLDLQYNNITSEGASALGRALERNSTLTTLDLRSKNITDEGASALARALETNSTLTTLDLRSNNITDEGASALARALETNSTLTTLDLHNNQITDEGAGALARALESNSTLTKLDLWGNNITAEGAIALAHALESNSTLTKLDLWGNNITNKGASALARALESNCTLTTLYLQKDNITDEGASALARALESNCTLTTLYLQEDNITDEGASALARALESNCTLTKLTLQTNNITDEGASALARALESNCTLTKLNLQSNNITAEGASDLARALESNSTLTTLDLKYNKITAEGASDLARALESNSTLTTLDLKYNKITAEGASDLARALESNSTLTTLDLKYNKITAEGASDLARALESNSTLTTLDLGVNNITSKGASDLARALESNSSLTTLNLGVNNITFKGASDLARALESNSSLTTLDLGGNNITFKGASDLARALESNSSLTTLNLGVNNITSKGASDLARALESNSTLTKLDLQKNNITSEGASALARALESNSTLTTLHLGNNNITAEGAIALAHALESNSTLTKLDLWGNNITNKGASALARALESNFTLTTLYLQEDNITDEGASALARALESNSSLTALYLECNNITDEGAIALARALESNCTLTKLNLGEINITDEGASALARALESNSTLTKLNLQSNNITDEGASALARALESNSTLTKLNLKYNNISNSTKSKLRQIEPNRASLQIFL
ncbi:hypothetical protein P9112_000457 [Eukaryota sp. TZLM1-RC]